MPKQPCRALLLTIALAIGLSCHATIASAQKRAHLEAVSVHLLLVRSGTLSEDITRIADFGSWNSESRGAALPDKEMFDSAVIRLQFHADGEVFAKGVQAKVTLRDQEGGRRTRTEDVRDVYIPPEGTAHKFIFLQNVSCKPLLVTVTGDGKPIRVNLPFRCGE